MLISLKNLKTSAFGGREIDFYFFFKAEQCWKYFAGLLGKQFLVCFMKDNGIKNHSLKDIQ